MGRGEGWVGGCARTTGWGAGLCWRGEGRKMDPRMREDTGWGRALGKEGRDGLAGMARITGRGRVCVGGGRVSTRGHGMGRDGLAGLCSRGEGWVSACARTTGRGRICVRGGRDGLADARGQAMREDTEGGGMVFARGGYSRGWRREGGWVSACVRTREGVVGERGGMGPRIREDTGRGSGFVPRLRGGRVSTRGWRREDGSPHARGHGGGCWFLCLLLAIVRFPRGGRGSRGLIYEGAMRLYACQ